MTPLHLHILLDAFTGGVHPHFNPVAPAVRDYAKQLVEMGALEVAAVAHDIPIRWTLTARGRAWVDLILETPMPVCRWVDPRDEQRAA